MMRVAPRLTDRLTAYCYGTVLIVSDLKRACRAVPVCPLRSRRATSSRRRILAIFFRMRRSPVPAFAAAALVIAALAVHGTVDESDEKWMEVLRKTPRQLEDMLLEFGVDAATLTHDEIRKLAYKEDVVQRWKAANPELQEEAARLDALAHSLHEGAAAEADPEKRRIIERLQARGIKFAGVDTDLERLRSLEAALGSGEGGDAIPQALFGADERKAPPPPFVNERVKPRASRKRKKAKRRRGRQTQADAETKDEL